MYNSKNINVQLLKENPYLSEFINEDSLNNSDDDINILDQGGFNHGDMSGLYSKFQTAPVYSTTRFLGWANIFSLLFRNRENVQDTILLDFLAGSGTLNKRLKQLAIKPAPKVIGLDVSFNMALSGIQGKELVFWGHHKSKIFKNEIADFAVAAYGFHHVGIDDRAPFVKSIAQSLKNGGVCLLHDFSEESQTAKFYSRLIDTYRDYGHPYEHFTKDSMKELLSPNFKEVEILTTYDPFYFEGTEGQTDQEIKNQFFSYIICLFNLKKLLPASISYKDIFDYNEENYWEKVSSIISPYFSLSEQEYKEINESEKILKPLRAASYSKEIPLVKELSIMRVKNKPVLIAPRSSLIGMGIKG